MSASAFSYTFDGLSRIGDDVCGISEKDMMNQNWGTYQLQNHWESDCGMHRPINFATKQPNIYYSGGPGVVPSCSVDDHSKLTIGKIQTRPKCKISLHPRPYLTVPYLGRGPVKPVLESKLIQGNQIGDKRSCKNIMEKSFRNADVSLVPSLQATIQNPANLVEGVASKGWIRGGLPSRDITRDQDYFNKKKY
jgi:hypothetical protein